MRLVTLILGLLAILALAAVESGKNHIRRPDLGQIRHRCHPGQIDGVHLVARFAQGRALDLGGHGHAREPQQLRRQLAESLDIKASQLRHDFHYFGGFSRPGRPYQVEKLVPALEQIIGKLDLPPEFQQVLADQDFVELPVTHRPRVASSQTGANINVITRAFRELVQVRLQLWREGSADNL
mgnify:CR=1 FL=1